MVTIVLTWCKAFSVSKYCWTICKQICSWHGGIFLPSSEYMWRNYEITREVVRCCTIALWINLVHLDKFQTTDFNCSAESRLIRLGYKELHRKCASFLYSFVFSPVFQIHCFPKRLLMKQSVYSPNRNFDDKNSSVIRYKWNDKPHYVHIQLIVLK